jgi:hypothetical protein
VQPPTADSIRQQLLFDPEGGLCLNEQPMILLPRHFFVSIMESVEALAGPEAFVAIFQRAGFDGALTFCRRFREVHKCSPAETVEGYLAEMSVRGWGQYRILCFDQEGLRLEVLLVNSALGQARVKSARHAMWVAAMQGAMTFLAESVGRAQPLVSEEVPLGPEDPPDACRIQVRPWEAELGRPANGYG